jgi:endonuclease YncB( thermonuclease family)
LVAALMLAAPQTALAQQIKGRPTVTSGDTMVVARTQVRLSGIDAPELDQYCENEFGRPFQCGYQALDALRALVGRRNVVCVLAGSPEDSGHTAATCYAGDMNLNTRMVRTGWAVALPEERPDYVQLEGLAKRERAGIWQFKFQDPAVWREENQ